LETKEGQDFEFRLKQEIQDDFVSQEEIDLIRSIFPELLRETLYLQELEKE
jgi:hypothetical protein